jgi:hypothetical protein
MIDPETRRFIHNEIKRQMQMITSGRAGTNTVNTQDIDDILPGHPPVQGRPIMHPYGVVSRAPRGTIAVTAQQGEHPGNKLTLGHRAANPPDVEVGETAIYSVGKFTVKVASDQVQIGKDGDYETMVVGDTLKQLLVELITLLTTHTHLVTAPGAPSGPPDQATQFADLDTQYLSNDKILAKDGGRF